jgi:hypothetical protein
MDDLVQVHDGGVSTSRSAPARPTDLMLSRVSGSAFQQRDAQGASETWRKYRERREKFVDGEKDFINVGKAFMTFAKMSSSIENFSSSITTFS